MLKFLVKALGLIVALVISGAVGAVGMGGISVSTGLGEPLKAEIDLVSVGKADKNKISARLASSDAFKGAGLDYPSTLPSIRFQIETRTNGEPYLKLTTTQPVNEPFVSLLVELTWPSGQLLREYTFLLDPPGFKPDQPKIAEVKPLEPKVVSGDESGLAVKKEELMPIRSTAPMDEKVVADSGVVSTNRPVESKPAESSKPAASNSVAENGKPAVSANVATGSIKVKSGDTLSKIARETKTSDISLERMLVAMYRANMDEFDGKNMNRIQTGKILRVPEGNDLSKVSQEEAVKEIHAQAIDWNAYRQKLAAAVGTTDERAPKQIATGKISTTVADKTPAVKEFAKEVVRLSKGEAPGDKAVNGNSPKAMQDKMHAMEEDATARNKTLKDSNERIVLLEKNIKEMQRLIELKGQLSQSAKTTQGKTAEPVPSKVEELQTKSAVAPEVKMGAASATVKAATLASDTQPASAVKPAKPAPTKVETPAPSLLEEILGEPLYLAGGAVVLGLGGLGFMLARRRGKVANNKAEVASAVTHIVAPVAPSPDTGDFTKTLVVDNTISPSEPDDVDPISEADLFLNFGRDVQAEEILKDALNKNPANQKIRLKLLSIYANRKDANAFSGMAREVQASGDAEAWAQAAEMGRKLEPGNPTYGSDESSVVSAGEVPLKEVSAEQTTPGLDFDLGLGAPEDSSVAATLDMPLDLTPQTLAEDLDFDLGGDAPEDSPPASDEHENAAEQSVQTEEKADLDFDLGFDAPEEVVGQVPDETSYERTTVLSEPVNLEEVKSLESSQTKYDAPLDFDITAEHPSLSAPSQELASEEAEKRLQNLDESASELPASDSLSLETTEEEVAVEAPAKADDGMMFMLDFPTTEEPSATDQAAHDAPQEAAKETGAIDLSEINLNLDEKIPVQAEVAKDTHWHDVATKLDLARAYHEMGDASGAREILEEVLSEGDAQQRAAAEAMLQQLPA